MEKKILTTWAKKKKKKKSSSSYSSFSWKEENTCAGKKKYSLLSVKKYACSLTKIAYQMTPCRLNFSKMFKT